MAPGSERRLGAYEILDALGAGGMGEVYRAKDTKLGREVALKLLPEAVAHEPERLARFEREARLLASLNHPNIGAIYGFEKEAGRPFLVLELVPGETLAERLEGGPIEINTALDLAIQIAQGLEAAHEKGIVHRDLKPANLKITPGNQIKILDFGLGKAVAEDPGDIGSSHSPTRTVEATRAGVILGTAAYMSPEQARGKPTDRRTDIWSFGCVLYEMLTGRRAFTGETVSDMLAGILRGEPDWSALPAATPPMVRALLRRSLQKEPVKRLQHIGDARLELEESLSAPATPPTATQSAWNAHVAWALAAVMTIAALAAWSSVLLRRAPPAPVQRFTIQLPAAVHPGRSVAISPDGTRLAFSGEVDDKSMLYVRGMDQLAFKLLPGTEGARDVVFSPDGDRLAFQSEGKVKRISYNGGGPTEIVEGRDPQGLFWGDDGAILFNPEFAGGIWRVPALGGKPQLVARPDASRQEAAYLLPQLLPNRAGILYTVNPNSVASLDDGVLVVRSEAGQARVVLTGGTNARLTPTGHLVYARARSLMAARFDPSQARPAGNPVAIVEGVAEDTTGGIAQFDYSNSGTLIYLPSGPASQVALVSVTRSGEERQLTAVPTLMDGLAVSPDRRRVAMRLAKANDDVHILDVARGALPRFTFEGGDEACPVWTPDGKRVIYTSNGNGGNLYWKPVDTPGAPERIVASGDNKCARSVTPDGKTLVYSENTLRNGPDIWIAPLDPPRTPRPYLNTPFDEAYPSLSPDGHWLAYSSNESGATQVYAARFPDGGGKVQISTRGGNEPVWSLDGREIFYRSGDKVLAVSISDQAGIAAGNPHELFSGNYMQPAIRGFGAFTMLDAQHFLMVKDLSPPAPREMHVVLNWFEELKRKVGNER